MLVWDWGVLVRQVVFEEVLQICVFNVVGLVLCDSLQVFLYGVFGLCVIVEWFVFIVEWVGVCNGYCYFGQLGCDCFVVVIGVWVLFLDQELLVVICGMVIIIDVVSVDGCFEGGMILLGFGIMVILLVLNIVQLLCIDGVVLLECLFVDNIVEVIVVGCIVVQVGVIEYVLVEWWCLCLNVLLCCLLVGGVGLLLVLYFVLGDMLLEKVDNLVFIGFYMVIMWV